MRMRFFSRLLLRKRAVQAGVNPPQDGELAGRRARMAQRHVANMARLLPPSMKVRGKCSARAPAQR